MPRQTDDQNRRAQHEQAGREDRFARREGAAAGSLNPQQLKAGEQRRDRANRHPGDNARQRAHIAMGVAKGQAHQADIAAALKADEPAAKAFADAITALSTQLKAARDAAQRSAAETVSGPIAHSVQRRRRARLKAFDEIAKDLAKALQRNARELNA